MPKINNFEKMRIAKVMVTYIFIGELCENSKTVQRSYIVGF